MTDMLLLCFGALAVLGVAGVILLDRRLARIGQQLQALDDLADLAERVRGLGAELQRKELNEALQAKLTELGEAQARSAAGLAEVLEQVGELARSLERSVHELGPPDGEALSQRVRTHLAEQGYEQVRILSDLGGTQAGTGRVVFEARRDTVMHKGHVSLVDGEVVDEKVRSAYAAFP